MDALGIAQHCLPPEAFVFCIVSAKRSERVAANVATFKGTGVSPMFFVADKEGPSYRGYIGTADREKYVVESGALCPSRNAALDHAKKEGKICVQMSDDIQTLTLHVIPDAAKYWTMEEPKEDETDVRVSYEIANLRAKEATKYVLTPVECAQMVEFQMRRHHAKLGGTCIHGNGGHAFANAFIALESFILGDFMVIDCRVDVPAFDNRMNLKEDYDYTASHLLKFGKVCRVHQILIVAEHRANEGGAVYYRNRALELSHIQFLKAKWPGVFADNLTRAGPSFNVVTRTLPFRLERRQDGLFVVDVSIRPADANKDSISSLHVGMRVIRMNGENLRKPTPEMLDNVEKVLYGYKENGMPRGPRRPVDLVFGHTKECPPIEIVLRWHARDVSLGGNREAEKCEFPEESALQRKIAQHTNMRQPSMFEYLEKQQKELKEGHGSRKPSEVDSAERLKQLLHKPKTTSQRKRVSKIKTEAKRAKIDKELMEKGVDMFMDGQSMGEITESLDIPEADFQQYLKDMERF